MSDRVRRRLSEAAILACKRNGPRVRWGHGQPSPGAPSAGAGGVALTVFVLDCRPPERAHSPLASTEGPRFSALAMFEHLFLARSPSAMDQRVTTLAHLTTRRPMSTDPATSCVLDGPPHDDPHATRAGCCIRFWHDEPKTGTGLNTRSPTCHHVRELDQR
jgi:hypothetical protein